MRGEEWRQLFAELAPQIDFRIWPDVGDPAQVRYLAAWLPPDDLHAYAGLEVLFSVGAGIDQFDLEALPARLPLVRMVEPGIVGGMVEYVTLAALSIHREWQAYAAQQRAEVWRALRVRPASSRRVGVLGLGVLPRAVLAQLGSLGFPCAAWSRSQHDVDGVDCYAGAAALPGFLSRCDILVCLLPLTDDTRGILNRELFRQLPKGPRWCTWAAAATWCRTTCWPRWTRAAWRKRCWTCANRSRCPGHALWRHPRVMLTPHIASMTQPASAVRAVLANLRRHQAGQPLEGLVERQRGY